MGFDLQTDLLRNYWLIIVDLWRSDYWVSNMTAIFSMGIGLRSGQRPVSGFGPGEGIPNTVVSSSLVIDRALGLSLWLCCFEWSGFNGFPSCADLSGSSLRAEWFFVISSLSLLSVCLKRVPGTVRTRWWFSVSSDGIKDFEIRRS